MVNSYKNVVRIKVLAEAFSKLKNKVVFVGGAVVELYCDDPARGEIRPTDDVDVVIEVLNKGSYWELDEELRVVGFQNVMDSKVIVRHKYHDIIIDIMPTEGSVLGFTNIWYKEGLQNSIPHSLDEKLSIEIFPLAYFLGSKFEALKSGRHGEDYRMNSDFEDIIYIFDNKKNIENEILTADIGIKIYLKNSLTQLLIRQNIEEEVFANLEVANRNQRKDKILSIWKLISE